jgi:hypothetical protein
MHINYFSDVVLFAGWCFFTLSFWTLLLSLFMLAMFIFMHIRALDKNIWLKDTERNLSPTVLGLND